MTAFPIPENHGVWWLTTFTKYDRLHAVPKTALDPADTDAFETLIEDHTALTTICGITRPMDYAGMFSRFSLPRCAHCCRSLDIPRGKGTPVNEAAHQSAEAEEVAR